MGDVLSSVAMGFTEQTFPAGTHMCFIYSDDAERRTVIAKFLQAGFLSGEKIGYFADSATPDDVRTWLAEKGLEIPATRWGGQFGVSVAEETYCPDGTFVPERMLDTLRSFYTASRREGYPGGRVSGEMAWALRGIPGSERLMEYEARVNTVVVTHPVTAMCQYDANLFDGATILDVLRVHPMMVVRGQVVSNPYYLSPEEFLATRSAR